MISVVGREASAATDGRREKTANGTGINRGLVLYGAVTRRYDGKKTEGKHHFIRLMTVRSCIGAY